MGQSHSAAGKTDMTPEDFDHMVQSTGFRSEEIQLFYEQFKVDFPKGYVDKKGFKKAYAALFPQGSGAERFADHIFRIYDLDGNGQISFPEFVSTLNISANGSAEDKLRSSFRMFDVDRSGFITHGELTSILLAIYKTRRDPHASTRAKQDADKIMLELDTDHNNKLSETEFIRAAKGCEQVLRILQGT